VLVEKVEKQLISNFEAQKKTTRGLTQKVKLSFYQDDEEV